MDVTSLHRKGRSSFDLKVQYTPSHLADFVDIQEVEGQWEGLKIGIEVLAGDRKSVV